MGITTLINLANLWYNKEEQNSVIMLKAKKKILLITSAVFALVLVSFAVIFYYTNVMSQKDAVPAFNSLDNSKTLDSVRNSMDGLQRFFTANDGQIDGDFKFYYRSGDVGIYLGNDYVIYESIKPGCGNDEAEAVVCDKFERVGYTQKFLGINENVRLVGGDKQETSLSFFRKFTSEGAISDVSVYKKVIYENIYQGIDLVYYFTVDGLKYDFIVHPGGDVTNIQLSIDGAKKLRVDKSGDLKYTFFDNEFVQMAPVSFLKDDGQPVSSTYIVKKDNIVEFKIADYDKTKTLIIDPALGALTASTVVGDEYHDYAMSVVFDASGNLVVTGTTSSYPNGFPYTGYYKALGTYDNDVFVMKINSTLTSVLSGAKFGGLGIAKAMDVAVDSSGNIFITGSTANSTTYGSSPPDGTNQYPAKTGSYDVSNNGCVTASNKCVFDAFVSKLNSTLTTLSASTYYGGTGIEDEALGIDVDSSGNVYITGYSEGGLPMVSSYDNSVNGDNDVFIAKFNNALSSLSGSTYLGGTGDDIGFDIDVTPAGTIYVVGKANSAAFPTVAGCYDRTLNGAEAFVVKMANTATLTASTFFGGTGADYGYAIYVDGSENVYIGGETDSSNLPTSVSAYQTSNRGGYADAFIAKFNSGLTTLSGSTYLGGTANDFVTGIYADSSSNVYVAGVTDSTNFPTWGYDTSGGGTYSDTFVSKISSNFTTLNGSTYLGGMYGEGGLTFQWNSGIWDMPDLIVDGSGNTYVVGGSNSPDFPTIAGAYDTTPNGYFDVIISKLTSTPDNTAPVATTPTFSSQSTDASGYVTFTTAVSDADSNNTKLKVEYSDDNGSNWYDPDLVSATPSAGSVDMDDANAYQIGTSDAIDTSGGSKTLTIVWDTKSGSNGHGAISSYNSTVKVRVTPNDTTTDGSVATSAAFNVDNVVPAALASLTKTSGTTTTTALSWTAATDDTWSGTAHYEIWYGSVSGDVDSRSGSAVAWDSGDDANLTTRATTSTTITGLTANTHYYYKIWATDAFGNETTISSINYYTMVSYSDGFDLENTSTISDYSLTINYTYPTPAPTGTKWDMDTSCNGSFDTVRYDNTGVLSDNPFVFDGLAPNTCYVFRNINYNGDGVLSDNSTVTGEYTSPPAQPTGLTAISNTENSITWDWSDVTAATNYYVYSELGDFVGSAGGATSQYTQSGLDANTQYTVYVRALNSNGDSIASSTASAYTESNIPQNLSTTDISDTSISWVWESGGFETGFYARSENPVDFQDWSTDTSWTQTDITANTPVTLYVKSKNAEDVESSEASITKYTLINAPTGLAYEDAFSEQITINAEGDFPNLGVGSTALYFQNVTTGDNSGWITDSYWVSSGLSPNTGYTYKVKARNGDGVVTDFSGTEVFYTAQGTPSEVDWWDKTNNSIDVVALGWFENIGVGDTAFYFENITNSTNSGWVTSVDWLDSGLDSNTLYEYQVKARNQLGEETPFTSLTYSHRTHSDPVTEAVATETTDINTYGIDLNWTNPSSASGLMIEQDAGCDDDYETLLYDDAYNIADTPFIVPDVNPNTCYQFRFTTANDDGTYGVGVTVTDQITTAPGQPVGLTNTDSSTTSITWGWDAVAGATSYNVYNADDDSLLENVLTEEFTLGDLSSNTEFRIYVRAVGTTNEGISSSMASAYTSANVPQNLDNTTQTTSSFHWTWQSGGAQKDYFARSENPVAEILAWTGLTFWNQNSLTANNPVTLYVKARNQSLAETGEASIERYTSQNTPTAVGISSRDIFSFTVNAEGTFPNLATGSTGFYFENITDELTSGWLVADHHSFSSMPNTLNQIKVKARNGDADETSFTTTTDVVTLQKVPTGLTFSAVGKNSITMSAEGLLPNIDVDDSGLYFENTTDVSNSDWLQINEWENSFLTSNTAYTYKVKARNQISEETDYSATETLYTLSAPVSAATLTNTTTKDEYGLQIAWTYPDPAPSGLKIEQDVGCDGYESLLFDDDSNLPANSYDLTGVSPSVCYQFRISTYNGDGVINTEDVVETNQLTVPPAIATALSAATVDATSIGWSWNDVDGATAYRVYNALNDVLIIERGTSEYLQEGLGRNTYHSIYVRAVSANGEGRASSSASSYTNVIMPQGLEAMEVGYDYIDWAWSVGDWGDGGDAGFYARTTNPAEDWTEDWSTRATWSQGGLNINNPVTLHVKARNSDFVETDEATLTTYTLQNAPTEVEVGDVNYNSVEVNALGDFPNLGSGSSGLFFENITNNDNSGWISSTTWENTDLQPNTQYEFHVKARNGDGVETDLSDSIFVLTYQATPVTLILNEATTESITVELSDEVVDLGIGQTALYFENIDTLNDSGWITEPTWVDDVGLLTGYEYQYRVKARNADGVETAFSDIFIFSPLSDPKSPEEFPPTTPTLAEPEALSSTSIRWNFIDNSNNEVGFGLYNPEGQIVKTAGTANLAYIEETGLMPNTGYQRSVYAYNNAGASAASVSSSLVYTDANVPVIISGVVTEEDSVKLIIDNNSNSANTLYAIYESNGGKWLEANHELGPDKSYKTLTEWGLDGITVDDLLSGGSYRFQLMAKNDAGKETALSEIKEVTMAVPEGSSLVLTKSVGVNIQLSLVKSMFIGNRVLAASASNSFVTYLPIYAQIANSWLLVSIVAALCSILLLILNIKERRWLDKIKHLKHAHKILFTDINREKSENLYSLMHTKDKDNVQRKKWHHSLYHSAGAWMLLVWGAILIKVILIGFVVVLVYGKIGVGAFENQTGVTVVNGDTLTYHVQLKNYGQTTATGVTVTDVLTAGGSYVTNSLNYNGVPQTDAADSDKCGIQSGTVSCALGNFEKDQAGYIEFQVLVAGKIGDNVINFAHATHTDNADTVNSNAVSNEIVDKLKSQCSDGVDNDADGLIDYSDDIGCQSAEDITENSDIFIRSGETLEYSLGNDYTSFDIQTTGKLQFQVSDVTHTIEMESVNLDSKKLTVIVSSDPIIVTLDEGQTQEVDLNNDGQKELSLVVTRVVFNNQAIIGAKLLSPGVIIRPVCSDTVDNDDDGLIDMADPGCLSAEDTDELNELEEEVAACADGLDNDADGKIDFPADPGCGSDSDEDESNIIIIEKAKECFDGLDNDNDGKIDYPDDLGCNNVNDNNEADHPIKNQCEDNLDNDADGKIDFPADLGCSGPKDNDETDVVVVLTACNDNIDNDDDNKKDFPADSGCESLNDDDESDIGVVLSQCTDGLDNDGDGTIDFPSDAGCSSVDDNIEYSVNVDVVVDEVKGKYKDDYDQIEQEKKNLDEKLLATDSTLEKLNLNAQKTILDIRQDFVGVVESVDVARELTNALVLDNPDVEYVADQSAVPVMITFTALGTANVATAAGAATTGAVGGIGALSYLQFFAMQPLMLLSKKQRNKWGVIYDSITKRPIILAIVRVFDKKTGELKQTKVSDKNGRYQFIVDPGEYYIEVTKDEYKYPSQILYEKEHDEKYVGLYHSGTIVVTEKMILNYNIPLDPEKKVLSIKEELHHQLMHKAQYGLAIVGPIAAIISLLINPTWWVAALFAVQVFLIYSFKQMAIPPKLKNWGVIYNDNTHKPISHAVVRIFDKQYNKLLESQITDSAGRYGFLVTKNNYYITVEKPGFDKYQSEEIQVMSDEGGLIARNIELGQAKV